jgi:hypothetical protein
LVNPDTPEEEEEEEEEDGGLILFGTPPKPIRESQGDTTITLSLRSSPEQARHLPPRLEAPRPAPIFRLFPKELSLPPTSTAPPRLEEGGRGKRKRVHTDRYEKGVAQGDIDESQHGKIGRP